MMPVLVSVYVERRHERPIRPAIIYREVATPPVAVEPRLTARCKHARL
jgi:hypothetical protein